MKKEYKIVIYTEGLVGSILLGASRFDPAKFADFLNYHAADGWRVVTIERESRRELLFFRREAMVVIMERERVGQ